MIILIFTFSLPASLYKTESDLMDKSHLMDQKQINRLPKISSISLVTIHNLPKHHQLMRMEGM